MPEQMNLSCEWLIGHEVNSRGGEPLGHIVDLRVEPDFGLIAYAELRVNSQRNGERRCVVPFGLLQFDAKDDRIILDMHPQTLANTYADGGSE